MLHTIHGLEKNLNDVLRVEHRPSGKTTARMELVQRLNTIKKQSLQTHLYPFIR